MPLDFFVFLPWLVGVDSLTGQPAWFSYFLQIVLSQLGMCGCQGVTFRPDFNFSKSLLDDC